MELASALSTLYPAEYKTDRLNWLLVNQGSFDSLRQGGDPSRIEDGWLDGLQKFEQIRKKYLIY